MKFSASLFFTIFSFFVAGLFFFSSTTLANAQTVNPYLVPATNPDVPQNMQTYTQSLFLEILGTLGCQLAGSNPIHPYEKCLGFDPKTGKIGYVENTGGALGLMTNMIAALYNPPISSGEYLSYMGNSFGVAKPAYAASGYDQLKPLLNLWLTFRNIVYLLFVIVFVLIGFMIMLRIKIDPRTVMTIQNQIPKVIIGIVLVTFSFAIAGFFVDLMYLLIYLVIGVAIQADSGGSFATVANQGTILSNLYEPPIGFVNEVYKTPLGRGFGNPGGILSLATIGSGAIKDILTRIFTPESVASAMPFTTEMAKKCATITSGTSTNWVTDFYGCNWGGGIGLLTEGLGSLLSSVLGYVIGFTISVIAWFVLIIAILFALFRLWFALIKAYVFFIVDVVTAPFWIAGGMLPGGGGLSVGNWIKDMIANLAVFPAAIAMFAFGRVAMDSFDVAQAGQRGAAVYSGGFMPPLIGNPNSINTTGALIGIGVILLTPKILDILREALKTPEFKHLSGIGEAFGAGQSVIGAGAGFGWGQLTKEASWTHGAGLVRRGAIAGLGRFGNQGKRFAHNLFGQAGQIGQQQNP